MKKRILIVEDNKTRQARIEMIIHRNLKEYNFVIDMADNFSGAKHLATTTKYFAAIVDIDLGSPYGNGFHIIKEIAQKSPFCNILIRSLNKYNPKFDFSENIVNLMNEGAHIKKVLSSENIDVENIDIKGLDPCASDSGKELLNALKECIIGEGISTTVTYKSISYIPGTKLITVNGKEKSISLAQGAILEFFIRNPNISHDALTIYRAYEKVDSRNHDKNDSKVQYSMKDAKRKVSQMISNLRTIIEEDYIKTEYDGRYSFIDD
ncbi:MAG: hypothetical protein Q4D29_12575 [Lachnospiraceae bacterium]|nr:hypothetical protein [Lachnospiraceae bacterium]